MYDKHIYKIMLDIINKNEYLYVEDKIITIAIKKYVYNKCSGYNTLVYYFHFYVVTS